MRYTSYFVLLLAWPIPSCVSKGDTNIGTSEPSRNSGDEPDDDGGSSKPAPAKPTASPSTDDGSDDELSDDELSDDELSDDDEAEPTPTPAETDDDDVMTDGPSGPSGPSDEPTRTDPEGEPSAGPEPNEPATPSVSPSSSEDAGPLPEPPAPGVACSPTSGAPLLVKGSTLEAGDLSDKVIFTVAQGADEFWVGWVDTSSTPRLGHLSVPFGTEAPAEAEHLAFQDAEHVATGHLAAVYAPEANGGSGAYALAWRAGAILFNWVAGNAWVDDAPQVYTGELDLGYLDDANGVGIAYRPGSYAITPLAQHPYLLMLSATGSGSIATSAGDLFSQYESNDVIADADGNWLTVGRYNASNGTGDYQRINVFDPDEKTGSAGANGTFFAPTTRPKGVQLVWDGSAVGIAFGGDASQSGLYYARVTTGGTQAFSKKVTSAALTPLDTWFDAEQNVVYVLATEGGADVTLLGIAPSDGNVVVPRGVVAAGSDVRDGYLFWDPELGRLRAFYSSKSSGSDLHQLYEAVLECNNPD